MTTRQHQDSVRRAAWFMHDPFRAPKVLKFAGKTDPAVALACRKRGWGAHACRADWEASIRYHGQFTL